MLQIQWRGRSTSGQQSSLDAHGHGVYIAVEITRGRAEDKSKARRTDIYVPTGVISRYPQLLLEPLVMQKRNKITNISGSSCKGHALKVNDVVTDQSDFGVF